MDTKIQKKAQLPTGVRRMIYAYIPFRDLFFTISRLSSTERALLPNNDIVN